jgi:hypothetical protein
MKSPSGFVAARTRAKKNRICSQPFAVMSELLRAQERVSEVDEQQGRGQQPYD